MNAELTAENRPACVLPGSASSTKYGNPTTYQNEGSVQVFVVLPCIISVEFLRFPPVHGEEVDPRAIGPQWIEEFFEGGMEAGWNFSASAMAERNRDWA